MKESIKQKLTSKVVWISVIAIVVGLIAHFSPAVGNEVDIVATAIVSILALFGILNNPNDKENF